MAGRGPAPKPAHQLTGHGASKARAAGMRVYSGERVDQPPLPALYLPNDEGKLVRTEWPAATKRWWENWGNEPSTADFRPTDWDFLIETARLHAEFWRGNSKLAPELRLRVAKLGATTEDRARLRITYASADEAEAKASGRAPEGRESSRARRGPLRSA